MKDIKAQIKEFGNHVDCRYVDNGFYEIRMHDISAKYFVSRYFDCIELKSMCDYVLEFELIGMQNKLIGAGLWV